MVIQNGRIYLQGQGFCEGGLVLRDGKIERILTGAEQTLDEGECVDAGGAYVLPGLVDIHFHGCAGHDFCEGTEEAFERMERYELTHGITTICPATMTLSEERLLEICRKAGEYAGKSECLKGIYLEGPFLSEAKKGAQNAAYLQRPSVELLHRLSACADGLIKVVAIAPELAGAMECIEQCSGEYQFSVAHTQADYETASRAMKAGARQVTHLYNAMPPFSHRAPGVIGAAFDNQARVELICDGIHIDPCVVRATFQLFGERQVILISDSMMATGMQDGDYELGGQPVRVMGNRATLADGTIAGSATNLYDCMISAIRMGVRPEAAIYAASAAPASAIGIDNMYGSIEEGKAADILIVNQDWSLRQVIKQGKLIK